MTAQKFSKKEALTYGWNAFKSHAGFFIRLMLLVAAVTVIPEMIANKMMTPDSLGLNLFKTVDRLLGVLLTMITTRVSLDVHDRNEAALTATATLLPLYGTYLVGKILYGLIIFGGLLLLVVPGLIWMFQFLFVGYTIIDKRLGPIQALKYSSALTRGSKMELFLFSLILLGMNVLGMIPFMLGLFVTIPVTLMASAYVYRRLGASSNS